MYPPTVPIILPPYHQAAKEPGNKGWYFSVSVKKREFFPWNS